MEKKSSAEDETKTENQYIKKRKYPRAPCAWKVRVISEEKSVYEARCIDISMGGVLIKAHEKFKKGDNLYLQISGYFEGQKKLLEVVGRVAYVVLNSGQFKIGLKFETDTTPFQEFLKHYIHEKLSY